MIDDYQAQDIDILFAFFLKTIESSKVKNERYDTKACLPKYDFVCLKVKIKITW